MPLLVKHHSIVQYRSKRNYHKHHLLLCFYSYFRANNCFPIQVFNSNPISTSISGTSLCGFFHLRSRLLRVLNRQHEIKPYFTAYALLVKGAMQHMTSVLVEMLSSAHVVELNLLKSFIFSAPIETHLGGFLWKPSPIEYLSIDNPSTPRLSTEI